MDFKDNKTWLDDLLHNITLYGYKQLSYWHNDAMTNNILVLAYKL